MKGFNHGSHEKLGRVPYQMKWMEDIGEFIELTRLEIRCACDEILLCEHFTNTCPGCGADYNMSGDLLADRSQWGEETGETIADILQADS